MYADPRFVVLAAVFSVGVPDEVGAGVGAVGAAACAAPFAAGLEFGLFVFLPSVIFYVVHLVLKQLTAAATLSATRMEPAVYER